MPSLAQSVFLDVSEASEGETARRGTEKIK